MIWSRYGPLVSYLDLRDVRGDYTDTFTSVNYSYVVLPCPPEAKPRFSWKKTEDDDGEME